MKIAELSLQKLQQKHKELEAEVFQLTKDKTELKKKLLFDPESPLVRSRAIVLLTRGGGKKRFKTFKHISDQLGATVDQVVELLQSLKVDGYNVQQRGTKIAIVGEFLPSARERIKVDMKGGKTYRFGVIADPHLCANTERLDILETAYDDFKGKKIKDVYQIGNIIDGECKFNMYEIKAYGLTDQTSYLLDHYPQRSGITTKFITGDCHEGWFAKKVGLDVGKYMELFAKDMGRNDLEYLGFMEHDIELKASKGSALMRLFHPGGGTAYAQSYKAQKIVESYTGGEKPNILILGHFHKSGYFYPRGVKVLLAGCIEDQSAFMRKKSIAAHIAYWIVEVELGPDGSVVRWRPEEVPFYDKKYYNDNNWIEEAGLA